MTGSAQVQLSLKDQVVVVTGGGTGIGAGIAQTLAEAGAKVHVLGRRLEPLQQLCQSVQCLHPIEAHAVDVGDREAVRKLLEDIVAAAGEIDVLVNSAGMNIPNRSMAEMRPEQWDEVLKINVTGAYNTMNAVLPAMRKRQRGIIVISPRLPVNEPFSLAVSRMRHPNLR